MKGLKIISGPKTDAFLKKCGAVGQSHLGFILLIAQRYINSKALLNHETIHCAQARELGIIFWYLIYVGNYLFNLIRYRDHQTAYRNIIFEKEAYCNDINLTYLDQRKCFAYWRK